MKSLVNREFDSLGKKTIIRLSFGLHDDDRLEGISLNAGSKKIRLATFDCRFRYPFEVDLPHPDACAFAAVKIAAPYIGSKLEMDRPISGPMATAIKEEYKNISFINSSSTQKTIKHFPNGPIGLAFSGGSDSMAAAYLLPRDTKLIALVREYHPDLGEIEKWHNGNEVSDVLDNMPPQFNKVPVLTDFPYTSLDENKKYVVWADRGWHSVPIVLITEQLGLSGISMGNIMAAFLSDEKKFRRPAITKHHKVMFGALGLSSIQPLAGSSEFISEDIVRRNGHKGKTLTCNFGPYKKPCMACVKCLRKSLINHVLDGTKPTNEEIERFNSSKRIKDLSEKRPIPLTATLKQLFNEIGMKFPGIIGEIQKTVNSDYPDDPAWTRKIYQPFYDQTPDMKIYYNKLIKYANPMSEEEIKILESLNIQAR